MFESSKSISEISRRQIGELQTRGIETSLNFVERKIRDLPNESLENARNLVRRKIDAVWQLIWEITVNLESFGYDPITFKERALAWGFNPEEAERLSRFYEIDSIEKPIANEIAFLYYINLNDEWYFHIMNPNMKELSPHVRPIQCLLAILNEDVEIRDWFSACVANLVKFQEEVLQTTHEFYNKIRIQS